MPTRARTLANLFNDSIVPASNLAYDLGSSTNRFKDLYLSGSTLNLGGATMKTDDTTGTIALVAKPTASNPNPSALVITSEGRTTAVATTGGTVNFTTVATQLQSNPGFSGSYTDLTNKPTTTDITEGTNLYYTDARARSAISVSGSGSYNSSTGVITVTGGVTSVNTLTGAVTLSTTNITEGTNLYYTDARARAAISLASGGTYNSSTGVLTITGGEGGLSNLDGGVPDSIYSAITTSPIDGGTP